MEMEGGGGDEGSGVEMEEDRSDQRAQLTPLKTILENFLLTEQTQPSVTATRKSRGTWVSYTPSMSGADS